MKQKEEIKKILQNKPQYTNALFRRGYLITTNKDLKINDYPFLNMWDEFNIKQYKIFVHKEQDFHSKMNYMDMNAVIIGHAYNPFDMKYNEEDLLKDCIEAYHESKEKFFEKVNEFTGIYLIVIFYNNKIICVQDCGGMKSCYFGKIDGQVYITSHVQLVADLCDLKMNKTIEKLISTKCYNIGNRYLPGNMTPYTGLKRLGPNTYLEYNQKDFKINRFYPIKAHKEIKNEQEFNKEIDSIVDIMHKNCILATLKWKKPAISLSGGVDSKTTLSVANGLYDKFCLYSFQCKESEILDSNAAHKICEKIGQPHKIYKIPENNKDIEDFEIMKKIINHNTAYIMNIPNHEIRKYIFLYRLEDFDIELKSWISEIGRVYIERRFGMEMPDIFNARHLSAIQTRWFAHPILMRESDNYYRQYLIETELNNKLYNYEHADMIYWEIRMGSWGTNVISSLDIGNKVTMPFNNRNLIEKFLEFSHDDRKLDVVHKEIMKKANKDIYDINISVDNNYHKFYRIMLEKGIFKANTMFYNSEKDRKEI